MMVAKVNYCLQCGTALVIQDRFGRLRPSCPACGWVFFPDPKVAVAVLVHDQDKVLLVRRNNEPLRGYWTLPAGFMDAGEDPAQAAARECQEETGLTVEITRLLDVVPGQAHARGADVLIIYQAKLCSGSLRAGDDADQVGFFDFQTLPPLAFSSTRDILDKWQQNPGDRAP